MYGECVEGVCRVSVWRIRVQFHISLLGHALSVIDTSNPVRQVVPDIDQIDRLHPMGIVMRSTMSPSTHPENGTRSVFLIESTIIGTDTKCALMKYTNILYTK